MLEPALTPLPAIAHKASEVTGHYHVTAPMIFQATPRLPGQGSTKQPVQTFPWEDVRPLEGTCTSPLTWEH